MDDKGGGNCNTSKFTIKITKLGLPHLNMTRPKAWHQNGRTQVNLPYSAVSVVIGNEYSN